MQSTGSGGGGGVMMMNSRNHWQWAHDDDDDDGYGDVVTSNIDSKLTELAVRNKI